MGNSLLKGNILDEALSLLKFFIIIERIQPGKQWLEQYSSGFANYRKQNKFRILSSKGLISDNKNY